MYLRSWWSKTYSRPLKDPLLDTYTIEELYYEYCDHIERTEAAEHKAEEDSDRIEDKKFESALDWAEQEEQKEIEAEKQKQQKWMEEQIRQNKEELGEDFGENISVDFANI